MSRLEIVSAGVFASLQDGGRFGWRRAGVPSSGALDPHLLRMANAFVGNLHTAAAIECIDGGLRLAAREGPVRVAVAGEATIERVDTAGQTHRVSSWRSLTLADGEQLRLVSTGAGRLAMIAVAGMALSPVLGSVATYPRARLGGLHGRALAAGDRLPAGAPDGPELRLGSPPTQRDGPIRVVIGPQQDHFAPGEVDAFLQRTWTVGHEADRMGLRLAGEPLRHLDAARREIVSDAIVPGAIQVPGNGLPIVLLADSQTAGGYPKIATVISADRGRIAARRPGQSLRFEAVSVAEAEALARAAENALQHALKNLSSLAGDAPVDLDALYGNNLLSGMVNALSPGTDDPEAGP
jgi:allophanate hydrolase